MKQLALLVPLIGLLTGCGTTQNYKPVTAAGPAKPAGYPIPIYNEDMRIPRPCRLIGEFAIGDTQLTMFGGSLEGVMKTLMDTAHEKGADVVELMSLKKPDFESAHYRVEANLLRYADQWETVKLTESEFLNYLQTHAQTLDPIEGVWTDGSPERIGIMRDTAKPGRDFIAFLLTVEVPSWQPGYKKMDIARDAQPGTYSLKFYLPDFSRARTTVRLDHGRRLSFILHANDVATEVTYDKTSGPLPVQ